MFRNEPPEVLFNQLSVLCSLNQHLDYRRAALRSAINSNKFGLWLSLNQHLDYRRAALRSEE